MNRCLWMIAISLCLIAAILTHQELRALKTQETINALTEQTKKLTCAADVALGACILLLEDFIERQQAKYITVTVTAYEPKTSQTDSTPHLTCLNKPVKPGTIAVSRDLLSRFYFGEDVYLEGLGVYKIADVMHPRWRKRVDVVCFSTGEVRRIGKRDNVRMAGIE